MEKTVYLSENDSKLLTNQRFEFKYSEVKTKLKQLMVDGLIDEKQFEKIQDEDILLKIKYKSYKKCIKQLIVGLILKGIGFGLLSDSSLRYLFIVGGLILSISSFFGISSNKLSKSQKDYLKK
ncbi:MAG: hypothetical protein WBB24_13905 [Maribacter sp.]